MDTSIEDAVKSALADPDIMSKVSSVLSSLGGDSNDDTSPSDPPVAPLNLSSMMPDDDRVRLLKAIKPFLSEKRAPYMDSAINILRLTAMGKLGKDLNLF